MGAALYTHAVTTSVPASNTTTPRVKLGFQVKAGMVPPRYILPDYAEERKSQFEEWLFHYIHHNVRTHPLTPYPHCQVYINHDYKFIWIKGHKVGSTALRGPLGWLCDDHWKIPENASFDHCSHALWRTAVTVDEALAYWKEYFVFGVVRNPYDRFASAYEYIKSGNMSGNCDYAIRQFSFGEVCDDPYLDAVTCVLGECWCAGHHFRHFMPQAPCLLTESLMPAVDYIADMASLDTDLEAILATINERRRSELPPLVMRRDLEKVNAHNPTSRRLESETPSYIVDLYRQFPSCIDRVAHYFHQDFLFFGYEEGR